MGLSLNGKKREHEIIISIISLAVCFVAFLLAFSSSDTEDHTNLKCLTEDVHYYATRGDDLAPLFRLQRRIEKYSASVHTRRVNIYGTRDKWGSDSALSKFS